jgi:hypothetical protein
MLCVFVECRIVLQILDIHSELHEVVERDRC